MVFLILLWTLRCLIKGGVHASNAGEEDSYLLSARSGKRVVRHGVLHAWEDVTPCVCSWG